MKKIAIMILVCLFGISLHSQEVEKLINFVGNEDTMIKYRMIKS